MPDPGEMTSTARNESLTGTGVRWACVVRTTTTSGHGSFRLLISSDISSTATRPGGQLARRAKQTRKAISWNDCRRRQDKPSIDQLVAKILWKARQVVDSPLPLVPVGRQMQRRSHQLLLGDVTRLPYP